MPELNPGDDIRADIASALEAASQTAPDDVSPPPVEPVEAPPDLDGDPPAPSDQRVRDAQGRFAPKEGDPAQPPQAAQPKTPEQAQPAPEQEQAAPAAAAPPPGWSPASKAAWNSGQIPPAVIADVAKREKEMAQGLSRLQQYKGLDPYVEMAKQSNTTLPEALDRYIAAEEQLNRNPKQGIQWLAQNYGVDIVQLAAELTGQQQPGIPAPQPNYQAPDLSPILTPIQQELNQLRQIVYGDKQNQVQSTVEKFFADPRYPYADNVATEIAEVIASERAKGRDITLEQAYDKACRLNDDVWNQIQADRETARQAEAAKQARQKTAQAKSAARSITGSPSSAPPLSGDQPDDLRAMLEQQFAGAGRA